MLVNYKNLSGYVTKGTAEQPTKGLVLVQEWWGLNNHIKSISDKFASQGFWVVAPDLYHGKIAKSADEANHLMHDLDFKAAVKECGTWAEYLKQEKKCTSVGVLGFCMGGALSIACASDLPDVFAAANPYYGIPPKQYFPTSTIKCPLLLQFGADDDSKGFSDPEAVKDLTQRLEADGKKYELKMWEGVGHAFMNETRPEVYNKDVSQKAMKLSIEFFQKNLH